MKGVKEKVSVNALVSSFRETANRLDVRYGVGAKTNESSLACENPSSISIKIYVTKFAKDSRRQYETRIRKEEIRLGD